MTVTNLCLYLPSNIEFPTTVTEFIAIARPASIGSQPIFPTKKKVSKFHIKSYYIAIYKVRK
jgi:hypothetical protein